MRIPNVKPSQEMVQCQECPPEQRAVFKVWRFNSCRRLSVLCKKFQCKACHKLGQLYQPLLSKKQAPFKSRKVHQLQTRPIYAKESATYGQSVEYRSSDDSSCLQIKVQCTQANLQKIPKPAHLITNLAYRLKSHHTRNLYLRARLETLVDVNIMPASVYRLVFEDPDMKKLAPSSLEIGTYATDTVKIVGSTWSVQIPKN